MSPLLDDGVIRLRSKMSTWATPYLYLFFYCMCFSLHIYLSLQGWSVWMGNDTHMWMSHVCHIYVREWVMPGRRMHTLIFCSLPQTPPPSPFSSLPSLELAPFRVSPLSLAATACCNTLQHAATRCNTAPSPASRAHARHRLGKAYTWPGCGA